MPDEMLAGHEQRASDHGACDLLNNCGGGLNLDCKNSEKPDTANGARHAAHTNRSEAGGEGVKQGQDIPGDSTTFSNWVDCSVMAT